MVDNRDKISLGTDTNITEVSIIPNDSIIVEGLNSIINLYKTPSLSDWGMPNDNSLVIALNRATAHAPIFLYNRGDLLVNRIIAPEKRGAFLINPSSVNNLTDDGDMLLKRVLNWLVD
jgi:hypothetical protein